MTISQAPVEKLYNPLQIYTLQLHGGSVPLPSYHTHYAQLHTKESLQSRLDIYVAYAGNAASSKLSIC